MFMANIHDDLRYQLSKTPIADADRAEVLARDRFFQTLSNFTDPFSKDNEPQTTGFESSVIAWHGQSQRTVIDKFREFDLRNLDDLEHVVEGQVDNTGLFRGRIKAFGVWHENHSVKPKVLYKTRRDSAFGPFHVCIGTF